MRLLAISVNSTPRSNITLICWMVTIALGKLREVLGNTERIVHTTSAAIREIANHAFGGIRSARRLCFFFTKSPCFLHFIFRCTSAQPPVRRYLFHFQYRGFPHKKKKDFLSPFFLCESPRVFIFSDSIPACTVWDCKTAR